MARNGLWTISDCAQGDVRGVIAQLCRVLTRRLTPEAWQSGVGNKQGRSAGAGSAFHAPRPHGERFFHWLGVTRS